MSQRGRGGRACEDPWRRERLGEARDGGRRQARQSGGAEDDQERTGSSAADRNGGVAIEQAEAACYSQPEGAEHQGAEMHGHERPDEDQASRRPEAAAQRECGPATEGIKKEGGRKARQGSADIEGRIGQGRQAAARCKRQARQRQNAKRQDLGEDGEGEACGE